MRLIFSLIALDQFNRFRFIPAIVLLILIGSTRLTIAQDQDPAQALELLNMAKEMRKASLAPNDIREIMVQAANLDTTNLEANFDAAWYHLNTIDRDRAEIYLMRIYRQRPTYRADLEYYIAHSLQYGLKLDRAIEYYYLFRNKVAQGRSVYRGRITLPEIDKRIQECKNGLEFMTFPKDFKIENLGPEINSEFDDYGPSVSLEEDLVIFTSRRSDGNLNDKVYEKDNKPYEDIYFSKKSDGKWSRAANMGPPVNIPENNANLAFSPDGKTLFSYQYGDIYYSDSKPDGTWSNPIVMPDPVNSDSVESSITISRDGKTLYFASNRPGGYGGFDLYTAYKDKDGNWVNARNLGPVVNSEYDEEGPYIDYTGRILYYSSKGKKTMGEYDIFRTGMISYKENKWTEPENLGYPINTAYNDLYFTATKDGKNGYYASVRPGGFGYLDLYRISIPEFKTEEKPKVAEESKLPEQPKTEVAPLAGTPSQPEPINPPTVISTEVKPKVTAPKQEAQPTKPKEASITTSKTIIKVTVLDGATGQKLDAAIGLLANDGKAVAKFSGTGGEYNAEMGLTSPNEYRLAVEKPGYLFQNLSLKLAPGTTTTRTINLQRVKDGSSGTLRHIFFGFGSDILTPGSAAELEQLVQLMKSNASAKIEIIGHTDNFGPTDFNLALSKKRATAVQQYLISKGINANRITTDGFGESRPLVSNDDEKEGREINRRVEFRIRQ